MKLTQKQKQDLKDHDWDIVSNEQGNCSWISVNPEDGKIFAELVEHFELAGDGEDIKLLVVATSEGGSNI